jgi:hypothetical protein
LLLQEFNLKFKDKKGVENHVVDHLSQLRTKDIQTKIIRPLYADLVKYLVTKEFPSGLSKS